MANQSTPARVKAAILRATRAHVGCVALKKCGSHVTEVEIDWSHTCKVEAALLFLCLCSNPLESHALISAMDFSKTHYLSLMTLMGDQ